MTSDIRAVILAPARTLGYRCIAMLAAIALFAGCATTHPLMPTPTAYVGKQAKPLFVDLPADSRKLGGSGLAN